MQLLKLTITLGDASMNICDFTRQNTFSLSLPPADFRADPGADGDFDADSEPCRSSTASSAGRI
jgi:hypothetical protein